MQHLLGRHSDRHIFYSCGKFEQADTHTNTHTHLQHNQKHIQAVRLAKVIYFERHGERHVVYLMRGALPGSFCWNKHTYARVCVSVCVL